MARFQISRILDFGPIRLGLKQEISVLSRKLVFFANRNTQKNMQLLDKIHTVFTAALIVGHPTNTRVLVVLLQSSCVYMLKIIL